MLGNNLKVWLALLAVAVAGAVLLWAPPIQQGTGLIVATLAAGAGWLVRDVIQGQRTLVTICQAYAALIESHFEEISDSLSDSEIDRMVALAPSIASGAEAESVGARSTDPFSSLPDIRDHLHLLSPATVRYIWKWRTRGTDLFLIYDKMGTRQMSETSRERLISHYEWVKLYRDEYRDIGYTALKWLSREVPSLTIDFGLHERSNAQVLGENQSART